MPGGAERTISYHDRLDARLVLHDTGKIKVQTQVSHNYYRIASA